MPRFRDHDRNPHLDPHLSPHAHKAGHVLHYGVWAGTPIGYRKELRNTATATPHIQLFFIDDTVAAGGAGFRHFTAAINVKSKDPESRLVFWYYKDFKHSIIDDLENLPQQAFYPIPNSQIPSLEGLDFVRTDDLIPNILGGGGGQLLELNIPGPDNDILDKLNPILNRAIEDRANVYLFGSQFNFSGIHEVHMNQGSLPNFENGVHQDGAIIVQYGDHWEAVFLAFGSQRLPTDDSTGLPKEGSTSLAVLLHETPLTPERD
ncbi:hypothetical protein MVEG_04325 [Podila verticillata NRRL 6337]|nr:hypothetical protein MVEG_04325 [Podila verticillata NRRL 6337]